MAETITGGCACGAVRYECADTPILQLICHCRDCQQASGSAHAAVIFVPGDKLAYTKAEPKYHEVTAATGRKVQRSFCPDCGAPVSGRWPGNPLYQFLQASSLDDPSIFEPTMEVWVSRAQPWHALHPSTAKYDQGPVPEDVRNVIKAYFAARKS